MKRITHSLRARVLLIVLLALIPAAVQIFVGAQKQRLMLEQTAQTDALREVSLLAEARAQAEGTVRQVLTTIAYTAGLGQQDAARAQSLLSGLAGTFDHLNSVSVTDQRGIVFASAPDDRIGTDYSGQAWYRQAWDSRALVVGPFFYDPRRQQSVAYVAQPRVDQGGQLVGMVIAEISLDQILTLSGHVPSADEITKVFDQQGILLVSWPDAISADSPLVSSELLAEAVSSDLHAAMYTCEVHGLRVGAVGSLGAGLYISVTRPEEQVYRSIRQNTQTNVVITALIALVALALAWFGTSRFVLGGTQALGRVASRIAQGDLQVRAELGKSPSELVSLGAAMETMAVAVQRHRDQRATSERQLTAVTRDLERRVADRTRELERQRAAALNILDDALQARRATERANEALRAEVETRELAQAELAYERDLLHSLMDNSIDAIFFKDRASLFVRSNVTHARWLGCDDPDWLVGKSDADVFDPELAAEYRQDEQQLMASGVPLIAHQESVVTAAGERLWVSTTKVPLRDDAGQVVGLVGISRDVTSQRAQEIELLTRSQALASAPAGFWIGDLEGRLTYANEAFARICGAATVDELFGREIGALAEDPAVVQACLAELAKGAIWHDELRIRRLDSLFLDTEVLASLVRTPDGAPVALVGSVMDISDRKRQEQEVAEATERLRRSNLELEQFAYVASHDLQEPLRMVGSYTQLLARRYKGRLDDDADTFIEYAVDGARRMQQLINDLLAYSRVATRGALPGPVSSQSVLEQVVRSLSLSIEEAHAQITHDPLPAVVADETQLGQVFQNLVSNGIKFHGEADPHIHIAAEPRGAMWRFTVTDNGIGIDPQYFERVFIIFQRLHTRDEYAGTGIGLAVCKRIVERHGGRMGIESSPGQGSTFWFTLMGA